MDADKDQRKKKGVWPSYFAFGMRTDALPVAPKMCRLFLRKLSGTGRRRAAAPPHAKQLQPDGNWTGSYGCIVACGPCCGSRPGLVSFR
jgi:hypothetical protein